MIFGEEEEKIDSSNFSLTEKERKSLFKTIDWDKNIKQVILPEDYVKTQIGIEMEYIGLIVKDGDEILTECKLSGILKIQQRSSSSISYITIHSIEVVDGSCSETKFNLILSHGNLSSKIEGKGQISALEKKSPHKSNDLIEIVIEDNPLHSVADLCIGVNIQPIECVFNPYWSSRIISFFAVTEIGPSF